MPFYLHLILQTIFGTPTDLVPGLVSWKDPRVPVAEYGVGNFEPFVPPRGKSVGEPYYIVQSSDGGMLSEMLVSQMSPYKYFPPVPKSNEVFLHVLMLQLHKYPFVHLRFGPRGTVGIVRAENDKYWDILIRFVCVLPCVYIYVPCVKSYITCLLPKFCVPTQG